MRRSALRDALVHTPGLRELRRAFVPQRWRDQVKKFWTMTDRPVLSPSAILRLKDIFDRDLTMVGEWLGVDLCCDTFTEIAANTIPQWKHQREAVAP
jgi:hypothetical protein